MGQRRFGTGDSSGNVQAYDSLAEGAHGDWAAGGGRAAREAGATDGWGEFSGGAGGGADKGSGDAALSCFVEVRFKGQARRTAAVDSDLPTWNEQVSTATRPLLPWHRDYSQLPVMRLPLHTPSIAMHHHCFKLLPLVPRAGVIPCVWAA